MSVGVQGDRQGLAQRGGTARILVLLGTVGLALGCSVPPPTVQQGLNYGFRTPKQALESWRTAFQADLLDEEYRCFSQSWREANGAGGRPVTLLTYAEAREQVLSEVPYLRRALFGAKAPQEIGRTDREALLVSRVPGPLWIDDRFLVVRLRKQRFWEITAESAPTRPEFGAVLEESDATRLFYWDDSTDRFFTIVEGFRDETGMEDVDAVHLAAAGWEWKIDSFVVLEELPEVYGPASTGDASAP